MKTYHILVHFYEQEKTNDDLVMIITKQDYEDAELRARIEKIRVRHLGIRNNFSSQEDMVDSIFNQLAEEIDCIWCYCEALKPLVIQFLWLPNSLPLKTS